MFQFSDNREIWRGAGHPSTSSSSEFRGVKFPRNKAPLDFGDRAAHGARNEEEASDTGRPEKWMGFQTYCDQAT